MKRIISISILLSLLLTFVQISDAQNSTVQLTLQEGHDMMIDGTSNIRDWDAEVKTINANFVMNEFDMSDLSSLSVDHFETLELTIPVEDIESGSGKLTSNMHKYLKEKDHPNITFNLLTVDSISVDGNNATINATGVVNAAGVDHQTTMTVDALFENGSVTFSGTQPLMMTDFNIDPPTALFGTIRARDEIDIIYSLTFSM
ncbi:YceI family protein [Rhodohalobacter sp. 8-1]|uniref:YceI family protein n=1 Tax=Rhodohalobacter sp. 8-1 TaxID=3131972 RepID=UPI0030ED36CA